MGNIFDKLDRIASDFDRLADSAEKVGKAGEKIGDASETLDEAGNKFTDLTGINLLDKPDGTVDGQRRGGSSSASRDPASIYNEALEFFDGRSRVRNERDAEKVIKEYDNASSKEIKEIADSMSPDELVRLLAADRTVDATGNRDLSRAIEDLIFNVKNRQEAITLNSLEPEQTRSNSSVRQASEPVQTQARSRQSSPNQVIVGESNTLEEGVVEAVNTTARQIMNDPNLTDARITAEAESRIQNYVLEGDAAENVAKLSIEEQSKLVALDAVRQNNEDNPAVNNFIIQLLTALFTGNGINLGQEGQEQTRENSQSPATSTNPIELMKNAAIEEAVNRIDGLDGITAEQDDLKTYASSQGISLEEAREAVAGYADDIQLAVNQSPEAYQADIRAERQEQGLER